MRAKLLYKSFIKTKIDSKFRAKNYSYLDQNKSDEIFIGQKTSIPDNLQNQPIPSLQSSEEIELKNIPLNDFKNLSEKFKNNAIYFGAYIFVLTVFIFIIKSYNTENINLIQLNSGAVFFVSIYLLIFCIALPFFVSKKKVTLELKKDFMHIKSFPNFHQVIPINTIENCYINTHSSYDFFHSNNFNSNSGRNSITVNLEAGISIFLKNGKKILIGSSLSIPQNSSL